MGFCSSAHTKKHDFMLLVETSKTIHSPTPEAVSLAFMYQQLSFRYVARPSYVFARETILHVVEAFSDKLRGLWYSRLFSLHQKRERAFGPLTCLFNTSCIAAKNHGSLTLLLPLSLE